MRCWDSVFLQELWMQESPGKLANYILPSPHRASRAAVQAGEDDLQTSSSRLPKTSTSSAASTGHKLLRP